jgi:hypothetical protein
VQVNLRGLDRLVSKRFLPLLEIAYHAPDFVSGAVPQLDRHLISKGWLRCNDRPDQVAECAFRYPIPALGEYFRDATGPGSYPPEP